MLLVVKCVCCQGNVQAKWKNVFKMWDIFSKYPHYKDADNYLSQR